MKISEKAQKLISEFLAVKSKKKPLIVILGPTASGKTALSIKLAEYFHGEVISADSRQVYRGMNIGTDKITDDEMRNIAHHLLDVVEPNENFTLANYMDLAKKAIFEIHFRGNLPMLVGGTGLYMDAVTNSYELPRIEPNPELRKKYGEMAAKKGNLAVHKFLSEIDPISAAKIHANNLRYVIRAIEIFAAQNSPKEDKRGRENSYRVLKIGISWPRDKLYERINGRIDTQVARGILSELDSLLKICPREANSMTSLGYKEYFAYLDGKADLASCVEKLKQNTRNYAKRQITWFRRDPEIIWLEQL